MIENMIDADLISIFNFVTNNENNLTEKIFSKHSISDDKHHDLKSLKSLNWLIFVKFVKIIWTNLD